MARIKKQRPEIISGGYSAIPWAVLDSVSFKGASDKAKALLFALMRQHNGQNNGHLHLAKQWLYKQGWTCDENNRKACHELIERGLIVHTKYGGLNMGPNFYALTWYDVTSYVGLDITPKSYPRGLYTLCTLPPTLRRKPPIKKQNGQIGHRDSASSASGSVMECTGSEGEAVNALLNDSASSTTENNVFIPLPPIKSIKRIVGVKGKSGITGSTHLKFDNRLLLTGLVH